MPKATKPQRDLTAKVFRRLIEMFNQEAEVYISTLCNSVLSKEELSEPKDHLFFRGLAFEAFIKVLKREIESTEETMQQWENLREVESILNDGGW